MEITLLYHDWVPDDEFNGATRAVVFTTTWQPKPGPFPGDLMPPHPNQKPGTYAHVRQRRWVSESHVVIDVDVEEL